MRRLRRKSSLRTTSVQPRENSHSEGPSPPTFTEAAQGWLNCPSQFSHFRPMKLCEICLVVLKQGGRHGSSSHHTPPRRLIRLPNVMARTGLSKTTIWRHSRSGEFPKSVNLTSGTVGWVEEEINDWIDARIEARGALNSPVPARDPICSNAPTLHDRDRRAFRQKQPPARRQT